MTNQSVDRFVFKNYLKHPALADLWSILNSHLLAFKYKLHTGHKCSDICTATFRMITLRLQCAFIREPIRLCICDTFWIMTDMTSTSWHKITQCIVRWLLNRADIDQLLIRSCVTRHLIMVLQIWPPAYISNFPEWSSYVDHTVDIFHSFDCFGRLWHSEVILGTISVSNMTTSPVL